MTLAPNRVATVLLAHGSAKDAQAEVVAELAQRVELATEALARAAFLDHNSPSLLTAIKTLADEGAEGVIVIPALLSDAFHARHDVPRAVTVAERAVGIDVRLTHPLSADPSLSSAVRRGIEALGDVTQIDAVVVAAAGTGVAQARAAFSATVRSWRSVLPWRTTAAFIAGGDPDVPELVGQMIDHGHDVAVFPFLLADGALASKAKTQALEAGAWGVAEPLGAAPELVELAVRRRTNALRSP